MTSWQHQIIGGPWDGSGAWQDMQDSFLRGSDISHTPERIAALLAACCYRLPLILAGCLIHSTAFAML